MIANPAIPDSAAIPPPFTLNDLRVHSSIAEKPSSTSAWTLSGLALAAVLAIGAFTWLDPLRWFTPTEASPAAPAFVPSAEPARPTERLEIIAPLTPIPATKSVEAPTAQTPVAQARPIPALVVQPRRVSIKPEARGVPTDKTTVLQTKSREDTTPPVLLTKPEERAAPPLLLAKPEETAVTE